MKQDGDKNSFILYNEQKEVFDSLTDEQAGRLIKTIFEYEVNQKLPDDPLIKVVFISIRQTLDKNKEKWKEAKRKKSEAGKRGMQSRWGNKDNGASNDELNQEATDGETTINDNDDITEDSAVTNDTSKDNVTNKRKTFKKPTIEEIRQYCTERNNNIDAKKFWNFYESKGWKIGKTPMEDWQACVQTWETNEPSTKNNDTKVKSYQGYTQREYTDEELEKIYDDL